MTRSSPQADAGNKAGRACSARQADDRAAGPPDNEARPQSTLVLDPAWGAGRPEEAARPTSDRSCDRDNTHKAHAINALRRAIEAAQSGNRPLARLHLDQAIAADPDNAICWLWFAWIADSPAAAISALEQSQLRLSNSTLIEHGLAWARGMQSFRLEIASETFSERSAATVPVRPSHEPGGKSSARDEEPHSQAPVQATQQLEMAVDQNDQLAERGPDASADGINAAVQSLQDDVDEVLASVQPKVAATPSVPQGSGVPLRRSDRATILAIDDSPTIRRLVSMCLEKCGYNVLTAVDGMDALEKIKSCNPTLILMDINMPRLNGYQLCKLIKKDKKTRSIPVIMLSGKDGVFDKLRGKMCGCDDYIAKPFEAADLVQKVSGYLTAAAANV